jgi:PKD repeat protein
MNKQLVTAIVASLLVLSPALVSAQTTGVSSNASLIAVLTQLVQLLEQELQQLIAAQQGSTQNGPALLTATPINGAAPLTVEFHINPSEASADQITFGDDKTNVETLGDGPGNSCGDPNDSECAHTYTMPGTYTAQIYDVKSEVLGTATITVTGASQYSLTAAPTSGQAPLTVQFTASIPDNRVYEFNYGDGNYDDIGGITSNCVAPGPCTVILPEVYNKSHTYKSSGTYTATLKDFSGNLIATQTITVASGTNQPSATIDQNSLLASTGGKNAALVTITGEASNVSEVMVALKGSNSSNAIVSGGNWSATIPSVFPGAYAVEVIDNDANSADDGIVLATGTLTVNNPTVSTVCPVYTFPSCTTGTYIPQTTDANGCTVPGHYDCMPSPSATFIASPSSGTAPLSVTFSYTGTSAALYASIGFGDNSFGTMTAPFGEPDCSGRCLVTATHTYTSAGTYTAKLATNPACPDNLNSCPVSQVLGTATITVIGSSAF